MRRKEFWALKKILFVSLLSVGVSVHGFAEDKLRPSPQNEAQEKLARFFAKQFWPVHTRTGLEYPVLSLSGSESYWMAWRGSGDTQSADVPRGQIRIWKTSSRGGEKITRGFDFLFWNEDGSISKDVVFRKSKDGVPRFVLARTEEEISDEDVSKAFAVAAFDSPTVALERARAAIPDPAVFLKASRKERVKRLLEQELSLTDSSPFYALSDLTIGFDDETERRFLFLSALDWKNEKKLLWKEGVDPGLWGFAYVYPGNGGQAVLVDYAAAIAEKPGWERVETELDRITLTANEMTNIVREIQNDVMKARLDKRFEKGLSMPKDLKRRLPPNPR